MSSTRRQSAWINLRRSLRVGAWNVLSPREDNHLSLLSSELKRLNIVIAKLLERFEVRRGSEIVSWRDHGGWLHLLLVWFL